MHPLLVHRARRRSLRRGGLTADEVARLQEWYHDVAHVTVVEYRTVAPKGYVVAPAAIAAIVLGALLLTTAIVLYALWVRCRPRPLRIFLSYRVAADADVAQALYERLTGGGYKAWWHKECLSLSKGKYWEVWSMRE